MILINKMHDLLILNPIFTNKKTTDPLIWSKFVFFLSFGVKGQNWSEGTFVVVVGGWGSVWRKILKLSSFLELLNHNTSYMYLLFL